MQTDLRRHQDLLEELNSLYPLKNFAPTDSEQFIRESCAQRAVVERLFAELKYQGEQMDARSIQVLGKPNHV
jgi:hypothetical protein